MPEELVDSHEDLSSSHTLVVRANDADVGDDSLSGVTLSDPPLRTGYDWVSSLVTKQCSKYRWLESLEYFRTKEGMMSIEKCSVVDRVYHDRKGSESNFFYKYGCFFIDAHDHLPFDEFIMGVLCILNVAPTQRHPTT